MQTTKAVQIRQGEVFLNPVSEIPKGAKTEKRAGDIVLSRGSTTQHSHRIGAKSAKTMVLGDKRFLVISRAANLDCERHPAIKVAPGSYEVVIQRQQQLGRTSNSAD